MGQRNAKNEGENPATGGVGVRGFSPGEEKRKGEQEGNTKRRREAVTSEAPES